MTTLEIVQILVRIAWLVGAVGFVIGLSRMNSPATARNGNLVSAGGMAIAIAATADDLPSQVLSLIACAFAAMNVVGGYVVTDRMLQMFRKKPVTPKPSESEAEG